MDNIESRLPSLALFYGSDEFAIAERVESLKEQQGQAQPGLVDLVEIDMCDLASFTVRSICDTIPFLAEQRLVIVHNVLGGAFGGRGGGGSRYGMLLDLIEYFPHLSPFCSLVLVEKRKMTTQLRKRMILLVEAIKEEDGAVISECSVKSGNELIAWIMDRAIQGGGEISRNAASMLAAQHPDLPRMLSAEIEKLLTYVNRSRAVSSEDVSLHGNVSGHANIFHLVDAVAGRDGHRATAELHGLVGRQGYDPIQVFGMIVRQYRLLLQAREILDLGGDQGAVKSHLKLHPFAAQKIASQAHGYSLARLEVIYGQLLTFDVAMKTGADHKVSLDLLVAGLAA